MALDLNVTRTAVVLIDLQNWTLARSLAPHSAATIVQNSVRLANTVQAAGGIVVLVRVAFSPDYADMLQTPVDAVLKLPEGGIPDEALAFHPDIAPINANVTITKRQWSAFYGTELDLQLRRRGIKTVIIGGVATNFGVESTARDAWHHHYAVVVAEDASASLDESMHRFAIEKILPRVARIRSTAEILAALGKT
jgi:nicotinamidase-related amidase